MSSYPVDAVLQIIVSSATEATGAAEGWILVVEASNLRTVAAAGSQPGAALGAVVAAGAGAAGYVAASGEPIVLSPGTQDTRLGEGVAAALGLQPVSLLCVPCATEESVVGVLELVDKAGGGPFSFDDLELATILGGIAGVALAAAGESDDAVPSPDELSGELRRVASNDPSRYKAVAKVLEALLANG